MTDHAPLLLARLEGPPQTNETQRSAALCPGYLTVAQETGLPLVCSEIGASAGLNLLWDRFAYRFGPAAWGDPASPVRLTPDWRGPPPPCPRRRSRSAPACDRAPLDLSDPATELRLLSFVWADQTERLARTRAALALARETGLNIERADAADWLQTRLAPSPPRPRPCRRPLDHVAVPARADQTRIAGLIDAAGARAADDAPLAWLRLEPDGAAPGAGAAVTLTLWPGGEARPLGRADFHGRWVDWRG
jgi:hypothetical protein